ncbi:MAG: hypothetical protein AAGB48_10640 [Planctomycetota bacterium]
MGERLEDQLDRLDADAPGEHRALELMLSGDLPCAVCGYELSGLSVVGSCPECGCPIKTTLMLAVDPEADTLEPLVAPLRTAIGLVAWSSAGVAAAATVWFQRIADAVCVLRHTRCVYPETGWVVFGLSCMAGLSALCIVRPMRSTPRLHSACVVLGALLTLAAGWVAMLILSRIDPVSASPYMGWMPMDAERLSARLAFGGLLAASILLIRPVGRALSQRSVLLRGNHRHRQRLLALAACCVVTMLADASLLLAEVTGPWSMQWPLLTARIVQIAGSMLITVGLLAVAVDSWKIARAILRPAPRFRDVVRREPSDGDW